MKKVNITIGRFQPFTTGHMKCVERAWKELGIPTIVCMINVKDEKVDEKHPFPTSLILPLYNDAFKKEEVGRIILTRPAIEAGEKLGFLPGDLQSKVDPYLRPLYDALYQIMGADSFVKNMEKGLIEVAPLAYMRGRTLDNAFIILDEAQNTTPAQMKMFLTRIGFGSKVVITGDETQKDLPKDTKSGLDVAFKVLSKVEDIAFCKLTSKDVVRHPLVQKIVQAYEEYEKRGKQ